jgi:hypothetical protein
MKRVYRTGQTGPARYRVAFVQSMKRRSVSRARKDLEKALARGGVVSRGYRRAKERYDRRVRVEEDRKYRATSTGSSP